MNIKISRKKSQLLSLAVAICLTIFAGQVSGQSRLAWVELSVVKDIDEAIQLAESNSDELRQVYVYQTASGSFAAAIGPLEFPVARQLLESMLYEDSESRTRLRLSSGSNYLSTVWPSPDETILTDELANLESAVVSQASPGEPGNSRIEISELDPESGVDINVVNLDGTEESTEIQTTPELAEPEYGELGSKHKMQLALRMLGYYEGAVDGIVGTQSREAIAKFQEVNGYPIGDELTEVQLEDLYTRFESKFGHIRSVRLNEEKYGVGAILPLGLIEFTGVDPPYIIYQPTTPDNLKVSLISVEGGPSTLAAIHQGLLKRAEIPTSESSRPSSEFKIDYSDFEKYFFASAFSENGRIRGLVASWLPDQNLWLHDYVDMMGQSIREVSESAFELMPEFNLPEMTVSVLTQIQEIKPKMSASGFYVSSDGRVLTNAQNVSDCSLITLDYGRQAKVAAIDEVLGVALLDPIKDLVPISHARIQTRKSRPGSEVMLSGYTFGGILGDATSTFGTIIDATAIQGEVSVDIVELDANAGDIGGPIVDFSGSVVGMLIAKDDLSRTLPSGIQLLLPSTALQDFANHNGFNLEYSHGGSKLESGDLKKMAAEHTVLVRCY